MNRFSKTSTGSLLFHRRCRRLPIGGMPRTRAPVCGYGVLWSLAGARLAPPWLPIAAADAVSAAELAAALAMAAAQRLYCYYLKLGLGHCTSLRSFRWCCPDRCRCGGRCQCWCFCCCYCFCWCWCRRWHWCCWLLPYPLLLLPSYIRCCFLACSCCYLLCRSSNRGSRSSSQYVLLVLSLLPCLLLRLVLLVLLLSPLLSVC